MIDGIVGIGVMIGLWFAFAHAARRFERRRQREGKWNEGGPVDPTFAPPNPDLAAYAIHPPAIEPDKGPVTDDPRRPQRSHTDTPARED